MRRYKVIFVLRIRYSGLFLFLCVWCRMRGWLVFYFINFNIYIQEYIGYCRLYDYYWEKSIIIVKYDEKNGFEIVNYCVQFLGFIFIKQ